MEIQFSRYMRAKYGLIFASALLLMSLFSSNGIRYLFKIHSEIRKVKREIVAMEQENKAQEVKLKEVYNNPRLIEIYARSKLGMVKPDEIVYEINTPVH